MLCVQKHVLLNITVECVYMLERYKADLVLQLIFGELCMNRGDLCVCLMWLTPLFSPAVLE